MPVHDTALMGKTPNLDRRKFSFNRLWLHREHAELFLMKYVIIFMSRRERVFLCLKTWQPKELENITCFLLDLLELPLLFGGNVMVRIPLRGRYGKGKFALIDDEDFEIVNLFDWYVNRQNYVYIYPMINKQSILITMHRIVMNASKNQWVDHINHCPLDNQKSNLRICTRSQNQHNRRSRGNYTSQYKGVHWSKAHKKWNSRISAFNNRFNLGFFNCEHEAAKAYNNKAIELHGNFAFLNIIQK